MQHDDLARLPHLGSRQGRRRRSTAPRHWHCPPTRCPGRVVESVRPPFGAATREPRPSLRGAQKGGVSGTLRPSASSELFFCYEGSGGKILGAREVPAAAYF